MQTDPSPDLTLNRSHSEAPTPIRVNLPPAVWPGAHIREVAELTSWWIYRKGLRVGEYVGGFSIGFLSSLVPDFFFFKQFY